MMYKLLKYEIEFVIYNNDRLTMQYIYIDTYAVSELGLCQISFQDLRV